MHRNIIYGIPALFWAVLISSCGVGRCFEPYIAEPMVAPLFSADKYGGAYVDDGKIIFLLKNINDSDIKLIESKIDKYCFNVVPAKYSIKEKLEIEKLLFSKLGHPNSCLNGLVSHYSFRDRDQNFVFGLINGRSESDLKICINNSGIKNITYVTEPSTEILPAAPST